jgi:hypothetical protein
LIQVNPWSIRAGSRATWVVNGQTWFEGLAIMLEDNGETLLTCPVFDRAALHGVLKKVRDGAMPLVLVIRVKPNPADASDTNQSIETSRLERQIVQSQTGE